VLTDVVVDEADLEDALAVVVGNSSRQYGFGGLVRPPTDPGGVHRFGGVVEILETLRDRADVVRVDTPARLEVGDAMTIVGGSPKQSL
jgi:hypothetical protein